jgi:nucleotide-binding universal stress UspA family protein
MSQKPYVVIAGTDFSEHAARGVRAAFEQARQHAPAQLHVVHAVFAISPERTALPAAEMRLGALPLQTRDELQAALMAHLDEVLPELGDFDQGSVRVFMHVTVEVPHIALLWLAKDLEADLVVVGSHGSHGVVRWLLGSVAEGVVRQAECPVLVVPPEPTALSTPVIEPACPRCLAERQASSGAELWCAQHRELHGRRHTYHQSDRAAAQTNWPLVVPET